MAVTIWSTTISDIKEFLSSNKAVYFAAGAGAVVAVIGVYKVFRFVTHEDEYFEHLQWNVKSSNNKRVLVLGLDGAGKTRFVQVFDPNVKLGDPVPTPAQTVGFNVRSVQIGRTNFDIWDVGGASLCRNYWQEFLMNVDVIVWMVDSTSSCMRFVEAKDALHDFLNLQETSGIPVIIVATKQDLCGAEPPSIVMDEMKIERYKHRHNFYITSTKIPNLGQRMGLYRLYRLLCNAKCKTTRGSWCMESILD